MTAEARKTDQDGALQPALKALDDALTALIAPQQQHLNGQTMTGPSLYLQLWDAVSGEATNGGGAGGGSKSRPPVWVDAMDLCHEIDQSVEAWQPAYTGVPPTVNRLKTLRSRGWRPQDTRQVEQITTAVTAWAASINELMNPKPRWSLPNPCPACQVAVVYRKDSSGERVRQPALQIGPDGCQCQNCRYVWDPTRFQILAGALGYPLPPGVLE